MVTAQSCCQDPSLPQIDFAMTIPFLLAAMVIPVGFIALVVAGRRGKTANRLCQLLATVAAIPMIGFFVFGFLATGEISGQQAILFRLFYSLMIVVVTTATVFAWKPRVSS